MALAFVLDVERKDVIREIFPLGSTFDQRIGVLQDMSDAVLEIRDAFGIRIPGCYIVVAGFPVGAVKRWQVVFGDVGIVAPAAQLVPVVQRNCDLDV